LCDHGVSIIADIRHRVFAIEGSLQEGFLPQLGKLGLLGRTGTPKSPPVELTAKELRKKERKRARLFRRLFASALVLMLGAILWFALTS
jgi:hypothetical protein